MFSQIYIYIHMNIIYKLYKHNVNLNIYIYSYHFYGFLLLGEETPDFLFTHFQSTSLTPSRREDETQTRSSQKNTLNNHGTWGFSVQIGFCFKKNRTWAKALHLSLVQAVEDHLVSPRQCLMHRASHLPEWWWWWLWRSRWVPFPRSWNCPVLKWVAGSLVAQCTCHVGIFQSKWVVVLAP